MRFDTGKHILYSLLIGLLAAGIGALIGANFDRLILGMNIGAVVGIVYFIVGMLLAIHHQRRYDKQTERIRRMQNYPPNPLR